jgi:glycosyltransferase involved in cell wall biosynthesis
MRKTATSEMTRWVLYVSPGYFHAREELFIHLAREFNFRVIEVSHQRKNGTPSERFEAQVDCEIWDFPSAKLSRIRLHNIPRLFLALVGELRRHRYDLVISSTQHTLPTKILYFLRRWFGFKLAVVTEVWCYPKTCNWLRLLYRAFSKRVLAHSDYAFCEGKRSREFALRLGAQGDRTFVFPMMCEDLFTKPLRPTPEVETTLDCFPGHVKFGYVGRFVEAKGLLPLVRAFRAVLSQHPEAALLLVGGGRLKERLGVEIGNERRIAMIDWVAPEALPYLYSQLDAFVLPSFYDGWSTVTSEAASMGLPLIVTDMVGCAPDLVEHGANGYVIPAGDVHALEVAILGIIGRGQTGRRGMGLLSREKYQVLNDYAIHTRAIRHALEHAAHA